MPDLPSHTPDFTVLPSMPSGSSASAPPLVAAASGPIGQAAEELHLESGDLNRELRARLALAVPVSQPPHQTPVPLCPRGFGPPNFLPEVSPMNLNNFVMPPDSVPESSKTRCEKAQTETHPCIIPSAAAETESALQRVTAEAQAPESPLTETDGTEQSALPLYSGGPVDFSHFLVPPASSASEVPISPGPLSEDTHQAVSSEPTRRETVNCLTAVRGRTAVATALMPPSVDMKRLYELNLSELDLGDVDALRGNRVKEAEKCRGRDLEQSPIGVGVPPWCRSRCSSQDSLSTEIFVPDRQVSGRQKCINAVDNPFDFRQPFQADQNPSSSFRAQVETAASAHAAPTRTQIQGKACVPPQYWVSKERAAEVTRIQAEKLRLENEKAKGRGKGPQPRHV
uniref:Uncharacterized protein n=1 Tax=Chromera velia CCMP2878 TaxID=1169474 RepID=A0A0G4FGA2_9ALVE|eukprot:Cvel_16827.t1-p1 / transcript=Cvel_16827.t1 / gene=Cvel_16827 / organism=Chromera_velia_CCMP2878 / gene_product=hypothetical protein / transcript_product=hypothetical protein / location=Cvel_scaffold1314:37264-39056(+) / protein_length=397 / sequence_SO=supercontig / SO=protein_coding / is_pseudo=false